MTTPTTVSDAIDQNARGPKKVQVGGQSVEQHPIADQIAADQHAKGATAASKNHLGLRFIQIVPPGAG
jgi:methanogenic corrinoid protein MtbC1